MTCGRALAGVLFVVLAFAGCFGPAEGEEDTDMPPVLSCVAPCGTVIDSGRRWEPHVAVDPTDPLHLVASSQDLSRVPGGMLPVHWPLSHVSFDGGATWETRRIPGGFDEGPAHPLYRYNAMDDSVVTFLPDGTVLWSAIAWTRAPTDSIPGRVPASVVVLRSMDGGLTYPEAIVVQEGSGWSSPIGGVVADGQDKQWVAVAPDGRALLVWSRNHAGSLACGASAPFDQCTELMFAVSSDGGSTWPQRGVIAQDRLYSGAFPLIRADGGWVVSYHDTVARELRVAISTDEGATWSTQTVDRSTKFPMLTQVQEEAGERIYVVYPAGTQDRDDEQTVRVRWSDDGGIVWSGPLDLGTPLLPGRTIPAIAAAGDDGVVVLHWHPREEGADLLATLVRRGAVAAQIAVATMEGATALSGDYMGLTALPDGDVYAVWNAQQDGTFRVTGARLAIVSARS